MFESQAFQYFIDELKKMEQFDLEELVKPRMRNKIISVNEYSFLLRGRLEVYENIRTLIQNIINSFED